MNRLAVIGTDCKGSCKSNNHTITTTTAPPISYWYTLILYNTLTRAVSAHNLHGLRCSSSLNTSISVGNYYLNT
jgi:hypothetical protein